MVTETAVYRTNARDEPRDPSNSAATNLRPTGRGHRNCLYQQLFEIYSRSCQCRIRGVFKKRPNFLNSAPTSKGSTMRLLSAPSVRSWRQTAICPVSLWILVVELHPLNWARPQAVLRIGDKEEIQENAIRELRAITKSEFREAFQQWEKSWERCIASRGDYFEGDSA
jgi:hypothetical protein